MHGRITLLVATLVAVPGVLRAGDCQLEPVGPLRPPDVGEGFGSSLAIDGDVAIVGDVSGAAYVFRIDGPSWSPEQMLPASDGDDSDSFGLAVAVREDVAVIGAPGDDDGGTNAGAAYVFRFDGSTWVEEQKIVAPDAEAWDSFGVSVATDGNQVLVGGYDDDLGYNSGAVWIFERDGLQWVNGGKLLPADGVANQYFGSRIAQSWDRIVVGAYGDYSLGTPTGAAYIFRLDEAGWHEDQKLMASDAEALDEFGRSVAIDGGLVLIGARNEGSPDNGLPDGPGAAYVFRFDGSSFVEEFKLTPSGAAGRFGTSVAIDRGLAVVGDDRSTPGAAHIFRHEGDGSWLEIETVVGSTGGDQFGASVALADGAAVVGAPTDDDGGKGGSVHLFEVECDCPADVDGSGTIDVADLIDLLLSWGTCGNCPQDIDGDRDVDIDDLVEVILGWGGCG